MIIPEIGAVVELVDVKTAIFPIPLAPSPMLVLLFTQLKTLPAVPVKEMTLELAPAHKAWSKCGSSIGKGLMVNKKLSTAAEQNAEGAFVEQVMVAEPFAISTAPGV